MASISTTTAALDGDEASFVCPACKRETAWTGYTAAAFHAPLELKCSHCDHETFFDEIVKAGRLLTVTSARE